jgi:thioredoxin-like negative regulator of GroEL
MIAPVFEKLGKAHTSIDFIKIDVDEFNSAAAKYKISGVPAFFFKNGETVTGNFTGASEQQLNDSIAALEAAK